MRCVIRVVGVGPGPGTQSPNPMSHPKTQTLNPKPFTPYPKPASLSFFFAVWGLKVPGALPVDLTQPKYRLAEAARITIEVVLP